MKKPIKVMKFGGTSVANSENRMRAAMHVVSAKEQGFSPVVVVSAIGRKGAPYATDTLINELKSIDPSTPVNAREMDMMIACGEIFSAVIFSQTLASLGHHAQSFRGGQAGIRTDNVYGSARIVGINPAGIFKAIEQGLIPVICGFQGVFVSDSSLPSSELTTLGRGGSDTTGAAIGAALKAECVEIFTDVDGVKTADPDYVPNAPTLGKISYEEVAEIAHLGAKVLHPRAAEIAMRFDIPLWVKNTFSDEPGTEIVSREKLSRDPVTGVTHSGKVVYLQFALSSVDEKHRRMVESTVYEMMSKDGISLYLPNHSPESIGFAVTRDQYAAVNDLLDGLVLPLDGAIYMTQIGDPPSREAETQAKLLSGLGEVKRISISLTEGLTMVSLVGAQFRPVPGVFFEVLTTLSKASIPVFQTSDSDLSMTVLIAEADTRRAVRVLHDRFNLFDLK
jgi:aspartate kinase